MKENKEKRELLKWMIKRILLLIPVVCILFWIFGRCQTSVIKDQTKIGVTYMTMNNEFYKSIHSEISRISDERGALVCVRDPELDEAARMNFPSTLGGNWSWRMTEDQLTPAVEEGLLDLTTIYRRINENLVELKK